MKNILNKLWFLTSNKHKLDEVRQIAADYNIYVEMLHGEKIEIQSDNLEDIALYAALEAFKKIKKPILVEDAGLFINSMNGFPGPYSHYVYEKIGINGILKLLENAEDRKAYFKSVVVIIDGNFIIVETGIINGIITHSPRGIHGFGFDPIFVPEGSHKTFAEMTIEEKNTFSHRAKAVKKALTKYVYLQRCTEPPSKQTL